MTLHAEPAVMFAKLNVYELMGQKVDRDRTCGDTWFASPGDNWGLAKTTKPGGNASKRAEGSSRTQIEKQAKFNS